MEIIFIAQAAFLASLLTFFSGFGLGTLLMPVIALFLPLPIAIAITAVVHFANNILKFILLAKESDFSILVRFGIPAMIFAMLGAWALELLYTSSWNISYTFLGVAFQITALKCMIGFVILLFVFVESRPTLHLPAYAKKLWLGGMLSGFFGGLSGHQGAFRTLFLSHNKLPKEVFLATGVTIAVVVDVSRLTLYAQHWELVVRQWDMVVVASGSAFLGTLIGKHFLRKITIEQINTVVTWMLSVVAVLMIIGLL